MSDDCKINHVDNVINKVSSYFNHFISKRQLLYHSKITTWAKVEAFTQNF